VTFLETIPALYSLVHGYPGSMAPLVGCLIWVHGGWLLS
jgi:hypothetical protein